MTTLHDDPAGCSGDLIAGSLDLHGGGVLGVDGGVVRADATPGPVAVVVEGGAGWLLSSGDYAGDS